MADASETIWGIHGGATGDADSLFKKGYIALGWDELTDLAKLAPHRDALKEEVSHRYPHFKPGAVPNAAGQTFRFTHEAKVSDLVVYRSKVDNLISVGTITGGYTYRPDLSSPYLHVREVKWLAKVLPTQVTQGARYEIGSAMSFFQVQNYADEWRSFLPGNKTPTPTKEQQDDPTVGIVAAEIEELTRDFVLSQLSKELKGHPFAAFVAHLLETMGYRTRLSPEGTDGGVDIVVHRDELGFEPPIIHVQVKSSSANVGQPEVAALLGTLSQGEFGLFVTLGGFTPPAKNFAKNKGNLRLISGVELVDMVFAHYERFGSRYKGILPLKQVYVPEPIDV